MLKFISRIFSFLLSVPVYLYRYVISPFVRPSCRHIPSCSQYMLDALKMHGPFFGFFMGLNRILRCRPGGTHGYDPVPVIRFKRYRPFYSLFNRYKTENRLQKQLGDPLCLSALVARKNATKTPRRQVSTGIKIV